MLLKKFVVDKTKWAIMNKTTGNFPIIDYVSYQMYDETTKPKDLFDNEAIANGVLHMFKTQVNAAINSNYPHKTIAGEACKTIMNNSDYIVVTVHITSQTFIKV